MKNTEFHIPFIKSLLFVGLVTIVSMISAHYFIDYLYESNSPTPIYTSHDSQISSK